MCGVEFREGLLDALADETGAVVGIPKLGGDPVVGAGEVVEWCRETNAHEEFVGVRGGGVEMGVAGVQGCGDGVGGCGGVGREPEAETDGWDVLESRNWSRFGGYRLLVSGGSEGECCG